MSLNSDIYTIGIDIGGTKIAAAPFYKSKLLESEIIKESTPENDPQEILNIMSEIVKKFQKKYDIKAVGLSTAGVVNEKGEMLTGGNIKGWKGTKVKKELEATLSIPVIVENDANCSAFAEYAIGSGKGFDPALVVIVGTGIGGGLIYKNEIWRGAHFAGGEIGHIKISDQQSRKCSCGAWDCWEAYASGRGLQNIAHLVFGDPNIDNYKLMELHHKGDETALEVLNTWHDYLALGMSSVINTIDPDAVILSGGMAQFINYPKLNKKVRDRVLDSIKDEVNIIQGSLGNDSGMIGAACLANFAASKSKTFVA